MSYTPPTGIPSPVFGVDEDLNTLYGPASGKTWDYGSGPEPYRIANGLPYSHYIDRNAPGATDTGNTYGSPTTPRLTWVYPLPAGSCVQVHGSGYTFTNSTGSKMAMGGSGTASDPIFIYGISGSEPEVSGSGGQHECMIYGDYTIVERIRYVDNCVLNTRPLLKGSNVQNMVVRDCVFLGTGVSGNPTCVSTGGSSGSDATHTTEGLVVLRCTMSAYGDWQAGVENDSCGVIFGQNATNCWFLDSTVFHMGGDGARIGADQGDVPSGGFHYIGRCLIYENRENAIDVKQARNFVISENVMHTFAASSSSNGEAVVIHYDPQNGWLINNIIYNAVRGIVSTGFDNQNCYLIGNLIHTCSDSGMYLDRGGGIFTVYCNTVVNCANGIISTGVVDSFDFKDNIISAITDIVSGFHLQVESSVAAAASTGTNFLLFQSGSNVRIRWSATTYTSLAAFQSTTSKGQNSIQSDPLFADAEFRLSSSSPAISSGTTIAAIDATFQASFGVSMLFDYYGRSRPFDSQWDIGAYEFDGSVAGILNTTNFSTTTLTIG